MEVSESKFTFVGNPCDYHVKPTIALIEAIKKEPPKNGNEVGKQLFIYNIRGATQVVDSQTNIKAKSLIEI